MIDRQPTRKEIRRVEGSFGMVRISNRRGPDTAESVADIPGAPKVPTHPNDYETLAPEYKEACQKPEVKRGEGYPAR